MYLKVRDTKRWGDRKKKKTFIYLLLPRLDLQQSRVRQSHQLKSQPRSPTWAAYSQVLEPLSAPSRVFISRQLDWNQSRAPGKFQRRGLNPRTLILDVGFPRGF